MAISLFALSGGTLGFLYWSGHAGLIKFAYPGLATLLGFWLYASRPAMYLGYTLWMWFLTPFVRRVVDYGVGVYDGKNLVMLAPYLVTGIAAITILRKGRRLTNRTYLPLLLALIGVIYGYLVGLAQVGLMAATMGLLEWLLPVIFATHLFLSWRSYPDFRDVFRSTFTWGVLLMGVYTIFQYIFAPPWDMFWLDQSGMEFSMGDPKAGQFRVFGTLNSTGPFAKTMMSGLLLLFAGGGPLSYLSAGPGGVSLLLSNVRAAWGGWFAGVCYLVLRTRGTLRKRLAALLVLAIAFGTPLFIYTPNTQRVVDRAETITEIQQDGSFQARVAIHVRAAPEVLTTPIGRGIGAFGTGAKFNEDISGFMDSGILEVPLTLGWVGTLLYGGGLGWMLIRILRIRSSDADSFAVVATSVVISYMSMMLFNIQLLGLSGTVTWSLAVLAFGSKLYHEEKRLATATPAHHTSRPAHG
jgi:hypothetical protein